MEKERFNTTYFDEETVRLGVGGCCHDFALAIHRRTGWTLACLWREPSDHPKALILDRMPMHVFCIMPDGRGVDIEGPDQVEAINKRFIGWRTDDRHTLETYKSEADYEKTMLGEFSSSVHAMAPREHGIAGANKVINKSKQFLDFLREHGGPDAARKVA